jgi:hypothetical protein
MTILNLPERCDNARPQRLLPATLAARGLRGGCEAWLEADIHRIDCRSCGRVRTEQVLWTGRNAPRTPPV